MSSHRRIGILTAIAALAALGVAYYAEFVLHLIPCPLCYIERWPYRIVIVLGILAAFAPPRAGRVLLVLAALVLLGDVAIAFVHVGAEQHWWNSPLPECNAPPPGFGALPLHPSASCDRPTYMIPGLPISMATMDLGYALAFALAILAYLKRSTRSLP